jgi:hypothetical protein
VVTQTEEIIRLGGLCNGIPFTIERLIGNVCDWSKFKEYILKGMSFLPLGLRRWAGSIVHCMSA